MSEEAKATGKFWNLVWSNRQKGSYLLSNYETTHIKSLPNGWLLRHRFMGGKYFTRSSIIFVPDPAHTWEADHIEVQWERIYSRKTPNHVEYTNRLKTPQGWVIKEFFSTKRSASKEGTTCLSLTYFEDKDHQWVI